MFYHVDVPEIKGKAVLAMISLTPAESMRLISRGVAALPEIKNALQNGLIIIARGTTNAFVVEELINISVEPKSNYGRGLIVNGELHINIKRGLGNGYVVRQGTIEDVNPRDIIQNFRQDDIFIKGASAIDSSGNAAVLAAGADSGTIGYALPILMARAAHLIVPTGLERMIPSVNDAIPKTGIYKYKYSTGMPCALIPLVNAEVITEIQALAVLAGVRSTHVASGGIGGSEGAVVLVIEGNEENLERAFSLIKSVKGEPAVGHPDQTDAPASKFNYDPVAIMAAMNLP